MNDLTRANVCIRAPNSEVDVSKIRSMVRKEDDDGSPFDPRISYSSSQMANDLDEIFSQISVESRPMSATLKRINSAASSSNMSIDSNRSSMKLDSRPISTTGSIQRLPSSGSLRPASTNGLMNIISESIGSRHFESCDLEPMRSEDWLEKE